MEFRLSQRTPKLRIDYRRPHRQLLLETRSRSWPHAILDVARGDIFHHLLLSWCADESESLELQFIVRRHFFLTLGQPKIVHHPSLHRVFGVLDQPEIRLGFQWNSDPRAIGNDASYPDENRRLVRRMHADFLLGQPPAAYAVAS